MPGRVEDADSTDAPAIQTVDDHDRGRILAARAQAVGLLRWVVRAGAGEWSHGSRACGCDPAERVSFPLSRASEMKRSACVGSTDVAVLRGLDLMQRSSLTSLFSRAGRQMKREKRRQHGRRRRR